MSEKYLMGGKLLGEIVFQKVEGEQLNRSDLGKMPDWVKRLASSGAAADVAAVSRSHSSSHSWGWTRVICHVPAMSGPRSISVMRTFCLLLWII